MAAPPEKKRRIQENKSNNNPFPNELLRMIANYADPSNVERMGRVDEHTKKAVAPLLDCKNLIKDGELCFTERRIGDSQDTYRTKCPQECDRFRRKYVSVILHFIEDIVQNPEQYALLNRDGKQKFAIERAFLILDGAEAHYDQDSGGWTLHRDYTSRPITRPELVDIISQEGNISAQFNFLLDDGAWDDFSLVKVIQGKDFAIAPIFDHMHIEEESPTDFVRISQNLQGSETVRSGPPFDEYFFERDWLGHD